MIRLWVDRSISGACFGLLLLAASGACALPLAHASQPSRFIDGLFDSPTSLRQKGFTCHIYAAAALAEAACQKRLGVQTQYSRAYLFYLHLSQLVSSTKWLEEIVFKPRDERSLQITASDRGWVNVDLANLLHYGAPSEDELPLDAGFAQAVRSTLESLRAEARAIKSARASGRATEAGTRSAIKKLYASAAGRIRGELKSYIEKRLKTSGARLEGLHAKSADDSIRRCLSQKYETSYRVREELADRWESEGYDMSAWTVFEESDQIGWIKERFPFACVGNYPAPVGGYHAALVIGARPKPGAPKRTEWALRDSWEPSFDKRWREVTCDYALLMW